MTNFKKSGLVVVLILVSAAAAFATWRIWRPIRAKKLVVVKAEGEPQLGVQLGHSAEVRAVAFSHNGKLVVTGSADRTAVLWDADTGKEIRRFVGHKAGINAVTFSPDDHFVVTGSGQVELYTDAPQEPQSPDITARIWDVNSGKEVLRLEEQLGTITSVAFSPDGKFILTGVEICYECENVSKEDGGGVASLWSVENGKKIRQFKHHSAWGPDKSSVAFSPNGQLALVGFEYKQDKIGPQLWNIATGQKIRQFTSIGLAAFSPDGQRILVSNGDILDAQTGMLVKQLATTPVFDCIFSPDGQFVVSRKPDADNIEQRSLSSDERDLDLKVWNVNTVEQVLNIYEPSMKDESSIKIPTSPAVFSPDSQFVLMGWSNGLSHMWNILKTGEETALEGQAVSYEASFSPNGRFIVTGNELWDTSNGKQFQRFSKSRAAFYSDDRTALSPDGRYAFFLKSLTGEEKSEGILFDLQTEHEVQHYKYENRQIKGPWFSPNGKLILTVDESHMINLWDTSSGERRQQIKQGIMDNDIYDDYFAAAFSPDGKYIFTEASDYSPTDPLPTSSDYCSPGLFSVDSGEVVRRFTSRIDPQRSIYINAVAFSPDGHFVVSGSTYTSTAIMWDVTTGREIRRFDGHPEGITDVAFSPDGRFILTAGGERFVIVWEAATGKMIRKLESSLSNGLSVSFSPDGRFALTGSHDGAMAIWDFATGQELCRLTSFSNGDWAVTTPDGRFDTNNLEDIKGLHWIMSSDPLNPLPIEIFMRQYYEPRLLARILAGEKFKPLPSLAELNRTQPEVKIIDIVSDSTETVQVTVEVANAKSTAQKDTDGNPLESGVYDVRLFRDGQLVAYAPQQDDEAKPDSIWSSIRSWFASSSANDGEVELNKDGKAILKFPNIKLPRTGIDQVEFSAYAFNADRIKSATDRKTYAITPKPSPVKGRAYVISLGVNAYEREGLNLRYAANDARQVQGNLASRLATRGDYEEVISLPLVSDYEVTLADGSTVAAQDATIQQVREGQKRVTENRATKAHLRAVLDDLAGREADAALLKDIPNAGKLRAARPEDLVLISISSHGYTDSDGIFYIVPSDTSTAAISSPEFRSHCVSSDELSRWLRDVDAGELVMIVDACHSAAAVKGTDFKPGPMGSRGLGQLSYDKGMRILTATQADNVALEANKMRQGLLIYALLQDGLSAWLADYKPQDKSILLTEWLGYGVERVPRLYEEVKSGQMQISAAGTKPNGAARIIRDTVDPRESDNDKTQQPSLFDFARRRREVVLARQP